MANFQRAEGYPQSQRRGTRDCFFITSKSTLRLKETVGRKEKDPWLPFPLTGGAGFLRIVAKALFNRFRVCFSASSRECALGWANVNWLVDGVFERGFLRRRRVDA